MDKIAHKERKLQKKIQVMVPLWMDDYFKKLSDHLELNTSEMIRLYLCIAVIASVTHLFPEYKPGITLKEIFKKTKALADLDDEREEMYRILSEIYFEARKAGNFRIEKIEVTK